MLDIHQDHCGLNEDNEALTDIEKIEMQLESRLDDIDSELRYLDNNLDNIHREVRQIKGLAEGLVYMMFGVLFVSIISVITM